MQRVWLDEKLAGFPGVIAVRRLSNKLTREMEERLMAFSVTVNGMHFRKFRIAELRAIAKRESFNFDAKSFLCSQLVAAAFQQIGLLETPPKPRARDAGNYSPTDFSSQRQDLSLINCELLPEVYLKGSKREHEIYLENIVNDKL